MSLNGSNVSAGMAIRLGSRVRMRFMEILLSPHGSGESALIGEENISSR